MNAHPPTQTTPVIITASMVFDRIPPRRPDSHKGTFGSVLAVCGCEEYRGAAALCTLGALRSGAGLVTLAAPEAVILSVASRILEATFLPLPDEDSLAKRASHAAVCAAGCGKKEDSGTCREIRLILEHAVGTVLLDAGGLTSLAALPPQEKSVSGEGWDCFKDPAALLRPCAGRLIVTPHPGEMAKLTGLSVGQILQMPADVALHFAAASGAVTVLKGHRTLIATPEGALYENRTGGPGLARGGSGDILSGIIAGLAAQGLSPLDAALCGVWLHGTAADRCAARKSVMGMLPHDIFSDLGQIFLENRR